MEESIALKIIEETKEKWIEFNKPEKGFSIFYSPYFNAKLLIIGINPAGDESSFEINKVGIPKNHDYFSSKKVNDYRLARNMRIIFEYADLTKLLEKSQKINLNFFTFKKEEVLKEFEFYKDSNIFCTQKVLTIIKEMKPKIILCEGLGTFDKVNNLLENKNKIYDFKEDFDNRILRETESNGIKIFGILHPSGSRGFSNKKMESIGKLLKSKLN